jgi:hypothetical protein
LVRFEDKSTLFQNLDGGKGIHLPQLRLEQNASVAFVPSGDLLILQPTDKGFTLTTFSEQDLRRKAKVGDQGIDPTNVRQVSCACAQVLLRADGTKLTTFEGDSTAYRVVQVWTASGLKKVAEFTPPPRFILAALSKNGGEIAFGGFDGSVSVASIPRDEIAESLSRQVRSPVSLQWWAGGELAVIDGGGTIESWNPARGSSSLAFQSGPVAYPAISANGKFIAARTAANEFVIENVDDHRFESLGFKVNGRVASLSVSDSGDALLWSSGDLAHLDIDQAIKWTESLASNLDDPGTKSDTLGTLITLPLNLAKRTPQGWTTRELCRSKKNIPWGLFTSSQMITAGCSAPSGQEHAVATAEIQAMAQVPQVTVLAGSSFLGVMTSSDTSDIKSSILDPLSVAISPDGHWVSILGSNAVQIVDLSIKNPHAVWQPEEPIQASSIATSNKAPQVAIANNGTVYFVDGSGVIRGYSAEGKHLFNIISLADQGWIVLDTAGRFDTSDVEEAGSAVKWRVADDPSHPLPVEIFMRDYFTPKLLPKLLGDGPLPEVLPLTKLNRSQPEVRVVSVLKENDRTETVAVRVMVKSKLSTIQKDSQGRYLTSGVYDVRLFRNEQIVGDWPKANAVEKQGPLMTDEDRASWRKSHEVELDAVGNATITFRRVRLPKGAGVNKVTFTAYAFNRDRVKSLTSTPYKYALPTRRPRTVPPRAYLITMGVDANQSRNLDLDLAVSSADQARALLHAKLSAGGNEVVEIRLYSERDDLGAVKVKTASKADLKAIFDLLAGRRVDLALRKEVDPRHQVRAAGPDDIVALYIVSHGYADPQGTFYVMPYDTGPNWGVTEDQLNRCQEALVHAPDCDRPRDILAHSISSGDLAAWWNCVDAGKMIMILDSCHSGAVPGRDFRPGPLGDPGFGQLSYDKGMEILSASQSTQTEKGTVSAGKARTILVTALTSVAYDNPQQTLEQWLQGVEATLPLVAKRLYPAVKQDDVQIPLLLDFVKHNSNPGVAQQ